MKLELLDLTSISRSADTVQCDISLWNPETLMRVGWIRSGALCMSYHQNLHTWEVGCRLIEGVTDEEHDSSWAFRFTAVGVWTTGVYNGCCTFEGWLGGEAEDFRVPTTTLMPKLEPCSSCAKNGNPHNIARYLPEPNPELWEQVRGWRFEVSVHTPSRKDLDLWWKRVVEQETSS